MWIAASTIFLRVPTRSIEAQRQDEPPLVLETDPRTMRALEARGLSLAALVGASGDSNDRLAATALYASLAKTLERDLVDRETRPGVGPLPLRNHPFSRAWLRDPLARFDLVAPPTASIGALRHRAPAERLASSSGW
jgi:hypothetical protein